MLRGLGWNILRVWSTDWWFDTTGCAQRLHASLEALLEESRARRAAKTESAATRWDMGHEVEGIEENRIDDVTTSVEPIVLPPIAFEAERVSVEARPLSSEPQTLDMPPTPTLVGDRTSNEREYKVTDLSSFRAEPDQFFEFGYRDTLRRMIEAVIETESPLRADILAQRISRAHGWLRTGGRIRERIDLHLRGYDTTKESSGEFIWKVGTVSKIMPYRHPTSEEARRSIADIPLAELASVVSDNPDLLDQPDPARDLARLLGVERLAAVSRSRLDEALALARSHVSTTQPFE